MKKQILFAGAIWLGLLGTQGPAFADHDDWHKKYDQNGDGRWDYNEFHRANEDWARDHNKHALSEQQLHKHYEHLDRDHDGYLNVNEAARYHKW